MSQAPSKHARVADEPEPTWEIAQLFPAQGQWSECDYLALNGNQLVELSNGKVEVLPMPTIMHQAISGYLYSTLLAFVTAGDLGRVYFAPLRVRLWPGKFREPDVVFMRTERCERMGPRFWEGPDLVVEVVSEGEEDRRRDLDTKREEYARAGIPEYWIVDPLKERITVLRLARKRYVVHGEFGKGTTATSHLLAGFAVDVKLALSGKVPPGPAKGPRKPKRRA